MTKYANPIEDTDERWAYTAQWPDDVAALDDTERKKRVRRGQDSVILHERAADGSVRTRGFVFAILSVPLRAGAAARAFGATYGVFIEVAREAYETLQIAHKRRQPASVWGTLANRLPRIEDAYGSRLEICEDGSEKRASVVNAEHHLLLDGPPIGALDLVQITKRFS